MSNYVLGVDGGGTKTHCALFDGSGKKIDLLEFGTTNHERLSGGFQELEKVLDTMLQTLLGKHHIAIEEIEASVFGLAGIDTSKQRIQAETLIQKLGLKNFIVCNDAFLGIKVGSVHGHGICSVNGTGCTVCGVDAKAKQLQIGGQGQFTGEKGGGSYLGAQAVQAVYNALFRNGPSTSLTKTLFERFQVKDKETFIDQVRRAVDAKEVTLSGLAPLMFDAANAGDHVATEILKDMGQDIAVSINGMIDALNYPMDEKLYITLAGSVHVRGSNPAALNALKDTVLRHKENAMRSIEFVLLDKPPVAGAVIWAFEQARHDNAMYEKVLSAL